MGRCFLLLVVTLVVVGSCQAGRWHHGKVKARPLTPWTKWRCISEGLEILRSRKLRAHGHKYCPGGVGICHRIQRQKKDADGKCGKCGISKATPILSSTSESASLPNMTTILSVGMGVVIDGIAYIGDTFYALCHNESLPPPYTYQINVYQYFYSNDYEEQQFISVPSGGVLLGLTACASKNYLFFTDLTKKLLYRVDVVGGVVVSFPAKFNAVSPGQYDDVSGDTECNIAVATMGPNILKFTKNGAKVRDVSLPGVNSTHTVAYVPGCYVVGYLANNGTEYVSLFNASGGLVAKSQTTFTDVKSVISNAGFVLVLDGTRVALLNSKMVYIKDLLTGINANHMWLDATGGTLYLEESSSSPFTGEATVTQYYIF